MRLLQTAIRSAAGLPWRLAFGASALSGVAQIALVRELSASHGLTSLSLSIRLIVGVVLVAYGLGAVLALGMPRFDERRALRWLGGGVGLYLALLLMGLLRWLEPTVGVTALDAGPLAGLALLVAPPFVVCGLAIAHATSRVQAESPAAVGGVVALSLLGTLLGAIVSHMAVGILGVNSLLLLSSVVAVPLLCGRVFEGIALGLVIALVPLESALEGLRESRPGLYAPLRPDNIERVFTGWSPYQKIDLYVFEEDVLLGFHNGFWQWWTAPRLDHAHAFEGYSLLYDPS